MFIKLFPIALLAETDQNLFYDRHGLHFIGDPIGNVDDGQVTIDNCTVDEEARRMPPPRRYPVRNRRPPTRFDPCPAATLPDRPITAYCRRSHPTQYCAANSVGHNPRYLNSIRPVYIYLLLCSIFIIFAFI
jgi:hypothetical protein